MDDYSNIQINLISKDTLDNMTSAEKLKFIISEVKLGKVLILEQGLTATEQFELNKLTMSEIDHESFIGIEMPGFSAETKKPGFFDRLFRRRRAPRMMAIGPAKLMRIIKMEPSLIQTVITPGSLEGLMQSTGEGIPIDDDEEDRIPSALPVEEESASSESQSRIDEFNNMGSGEAADTESREELEMLIGPELREDISGTQEEGDTIESQPTEPSTEDAPEDESSDAESQTEPDSDEPESNGEEQTENVPDIKSGYVLRRLKDDEEEDD